MKFVQAKRLKSFLFWVIFLMLQNKSFPKDFVSTYKSMRYILRLNKKFPKTAICVTLWLENQDFTCRV